MPDTVKIKTDVWNLVKRQGLSFILLCAITYYFFTEVKIMKTEIKQSQDQYMDCVQEQNAILIEALNRNSNALEQFNDE